MKAFLKNYRQSPRKVRLVAELIKGKRVAEAILILETMPKRATGPISKLLLSAVSNAKQQSPTLKEEDLFIENVTVNKGIVLKRSMPRARGSASRINKRTSHVMLTLIEKSVDPKKEKKTKEDKKVVASPATHQKGGKKIKTLETIT
jgi:large subunit ribosomal protein L22